MDFSITEMLINIEITSEEFSTMNPEENLHFFSEVIRSSRLGFHRVIVPRPVVDWAKENLDLSGLEIAHLSRLRGDYAQLAGQVQHAAVYLSVVKEGGVSVAEGGRRVIIGLETLISRGYLRESVLLLENGATDGAIFGLILRHEAQRLSFGHVSYEVFNGGGATTAAELRRLAESGRVIACVCDTDLKVPDGSRSATYNSMMQTASSLQLVGVAAGTPGSEVENFLPLSVFQRLYGETNSGTCNALAEIMTRQGACSSTDCFWLHFDLKEGTSKLLPHLSTTAKVKWACLKLNLNEDDLPNVEIAGFGSGIISLFLNDGAAQAEFHRFARSQYWINQFSGWIGKILWVLCGRIPLRTG